MYDKKGNLLFEGLNHSTDVVRQVSECSGIWHRQINFDGEEVWNINVNKPYKLKKDKFALPSDANYRRDVTSWKTKEVEKSQVIKEQMETE